MRRVDCPARARTRRVVAVSKHYRIRVWGKPRRNVDPQMLAQVMLLVGQHLAEQQRRRGRHRAGDAKPESAAEPCC